MTHIIDSMSVSWRNVIRILVCYFVFSVNPFLSNAQPQSSVLTNRLCKSWRMEKLVQGDKEVIADNAVGDFMLIIQHDHTVQQGMYPDGLIKATWSLDEAAMVISIKDNETNILYLMKIISVTRDELVLQDPSATDGVTIYYKAK